MKTEFYAPPTPAKQMVAPRRRERREIEWLVATFLWELIVIAGGILVGAVVALIAGLALGWLPLNC